MWCNRQMYPSFYTIYVLRILRFFIKRLMDLYLLCDSISRYRFILYYKKPFIPLLDKTNWLLISRLQVRSNSLELELQDGGMDIILLLKSFRGHCRKAGQAVEKVYFEIHFSVKILSNLLYNDTGRVNRFRTWLIHRSLFWIIKIVFLVFRRRSFSCEFVSIP